MWHAIASRRAHTLACLELDRETHGSGFSCPTTHGVSCYGSWSCGCRCPSLAVQACELSPACEPGPLRGDWPRGRPPPRIALWRHVFNVPELCLSKTRQIPIMATAGHVGNVPPQPDRVVAARFQRAGVMGVDSGPSPEKGDGWARWKRATTTIVDGRRNRVSFLLPLALQCHTRAI